MTRQELEALISETYNASADFPWMQYPQHEVFRHGSSGKWFALIMEIPRSKLGMQDEGKVNVVNFKCHPLIISDLLSEPGFFPAYHMNKENWITAALDGSADDDKIRLLLDISYDMTAPKVKKSGST